MRPDDEMCPHGDLEALTLCTDGLSKLFGERFLCSRHLHYGTRMGQSEGSRWGYTTADAKREGRVAGPRHSGAMTDRYPF